jgi:hypothetical protein
MDLVPHETAGDTPVQKPPAGSSTKTIGGRFSLPPSRRRGIIAFLMADEDAGPLVVPAGVAPIATAPAPAARDRVITRLSDAFAAGVFEVEELERRVTLAQAAASAPELEALVADLPAAPEGEETSVPATRALVPAGEVREVGQVRTVLGSVRRAGVWTVPRRLMVRTVLGSAELDFREARLPPGIVEVEVEAVLGSVEITVPPHLAVEAEGGAVLGSFEHVARAPAQPAPDASVLRIRGRAVLGSVEIAMALPGAGAPRARVR